MPILLGLLYVQAQPWGHQYFPFYFYPYWAVYIASAITLFFVTLEIFRSVLSSFSGLMRLGTVVFPLGGPGFSGRQPRIDFVLASQRVADSRYSHSR